MIQQAFTARQEPRPPWIGIGPVAALDLVGIMWNLDGTLAKLRTGRLEGVVDLQNPQQGFHAIHWNGRSLELPRANWMRLYLPGGSAAEVVRESWVRGADLVAVYGPTAHRASQPEIYWRSLSASDYEGLELIVAVHTGILDDAPATKVTTELTALDAMGFPSLEPAESERKSSGREPISSQTANGIGLHVVRLASGISYVQMVYPSDFHGGQVEWQEDRLRLSTPLFADRLEKGVIRKARLRGWLVPAADDLATARQLYREFVDSEPPLTT